MRLRKYEIKMLAEVIQQAFFDEREEWKNTKDYKDFNVDEVVPSFHHYYGLVSNYASKLNKAMQEYSPELNAPIFIRPSHWIEDSIKDVVFGTNEFPSIEKIEHWLLVYISLNDEVEEITGEEIIELALDSFILN